MVSQGSICRPLLQVEKGVKDSYWDFNTLLPSSPHQTHRKPGPVSAIRKLWGLQASCSPIGDHIKRVLRMDFRAEMLI